jgi:hypothetical protein
MNILRPAQRADGRWDFTRQIDGGALDAVGYCRGEPGLSKPGYVERYHDDGHATPDEACVCFHHYQVDQLLTLVDPPARATTDRYQCSAPDCSNFTAGYAVCDGWKAWLCDSHRNASVVAELMPVGNEIWKP